MEIFLDSIKTKYRNTVLTSQENIDPFRLANLYDAAMEINEWVLAARTKGNLTQTQLGDAMGVTKANVSAWENGRHEPSWTQMLKICDLTGAQLPLPPNMAGDASAWPFTVSAELFYAMPAEERAQIDKHIKLHVNDWHQGQHVKSKKAG